MKNNIIFLISQPRAGSTLLQRILFNHPEIHSTAEPWIMLHPIYALKKSGYNAEYNQEIVSNALNNIFSNLKEGKSSYYKAIEQMGEYIYNDLCNNKNVKYFLDKTPRYYFIIPELIKIFPNAKFIILLRNPLAVFSSILKTWIKGDMLKLYKSFNDLCVAPQKLVEGCRILSDKAIVVHYEKILQNPKQEIKNLCDKLDLEFNDKMLNYGKMEVPKGKMGDSIGIIKHSSPSKDNIDNWIKFIHSRQTRYLINKYFTYFFLLYFQLFN